MFTNWLTGPSSSSAASAGNADNSVRPNAVALAAGMGGIMSTPPDVILEVGPAPSSMRFVAHSLVLGMHSGYLRSAVRLDENVHAASGSGDLLLYLSNVTAEHFAPLLTYMYTGYLDLNVDNIFGVLLATHVLHMPRALEICRSFLARAQTEGYLGSSLPSIPSTAPASSSSAPPNTPTNTSSAKIIRPIPSKATLPNFGFLPLTHQLTLPLAANGSDCYKQLQQTYATQNAAAAAAEHATEQNEERSMEIEVARTPSSKSEQLQQQDDEDEEVEVFIDSNTETDVEADIDCAISVTSHASSKKEKAANNSREIVVTLEAAPVTRTDKQKPQAPSTSANRTQAHCHKSNTSSKRDKRKQSRHKTQHGSGAATGLQVAKAPIPASQLDAGEGAKVIIDVASCDGPVRFRRILNTAYGHKPEDYAVMPERTQQSVSLSFHQQMAKTISQQRQLAHANEESENSESSGGGAAAGSNAKQSGNKGATNEIYVCVYCKHTFKSQYCYQKHAKRHLNPLSLNCAPTSASGSAAAVATEREKLTVALKQGAAAAAESGYARVLPLPIVASKQTATELLRREVRPLDMNVQYYPCKTCGSKFPSYYFVHKHRKLCHAEEEAENPSGRGAAGIGAVAEADEQSAERKLE